MDQWKDHTGISLAGAGALFGVACLCYYFSRARGRQLRRRTSLATAFLVDRTLMQESVGMTQNVVNALLWFEKNDLPTRQDMVGIMTRLAHKFERLRTNPSILPDQTTCVWTPIDEDLGAVVDRAVIQDNTILERSRPEAVERETLQRFERYKAQLLINKDDEGHAMPHWRVILLPPSAILVRMDHCIGDGISLVTLLREIGTNAENKPLHLGDLSPLLNRIKAMGDWRVRLAPLKLLWFPNLWRAVSLVVCNLNAPVEPDNPFRTSREHLPIPVKHCGTVYFPTIRLSLFKQLARMAGKNTTVNDVVLVCFAEAVSKYVDKIGVKHVDSIRLLLPIANPICPSWYGDEFEGLCNHMTPVAVPLRLGLGPRASLYQIQQYLEKVIQSNAPLFMTVLNTILNRLLTLQHLADGGRQMFQRISCVYSNVPGPTQPIFLAEHRITKLQTVLPHPASIFQVLSYHGNVYFNITLDTRSAPQPWLLRSAFVDALKNFASEFELQNSNKLLREEVDTCSQANEWGGNHTVYSLE